MTTYRLGSQWVRPAGGPDDTTHFDIWVRTEGADADGGVAAAMAGYPSATCLARRSGETPGNQFVEIVVESVAVAGVPRIFELYAQMSAADFTCAAARFELPGSGGTPFSLVAGSVFAYTDGAAGFPIAGSAVVLDTDVLTLRFEADRAGPDPGEIRAFVNGMPVGAAVFDALAGSFVGFGIRPPGNGRIFRVSGGSDEAPALESTGDRISRWAAAAQWGDRPTDIDFGLARLQAGDMAGNALAEMQQLAFSDGLGVLYVRADGTLTFRQRDAALVEPRSVDVQATFTDRDGDPAGGCYSDIGPAVDETTVYNYAQIGSTDQLVQTASDPDSMAWYGPRTFPPRTSLDLADYNDNLAVAILIVYSHAENEKRVDEITIHADDQRDDDRWAIACSLRLLDRVRVVRHFPGGYVLDEDLVVQGIRHTMRGGGTKVPAVWDVTYRTTTALPTDFAKWDSAQWDLGRWSL